MGVDGVDELNLALCEDGGLVHGGESHGAAEAGGDESGTGELHDVLKRFLEVGKM